MAARSRELTRERDEVDTVSAAVAEAAQFLFDTSIEDQPRPIIPALKARFGLSANEACKAVGLANIARHDARHAA
ncbi:hypothetical protein RDV64_03295 [Acuticoccus sp. MNP-M23]|uniref:hypothetical protein n=1 Tax=Acuticoccus sp. MNP-M23 TaxID=3072793 RepID=UPI002816198D|nr:hypothetical protein [Acuticoccus sp. MNP-M23]WMS43443.1 hypothetical protein RDV64_03295 [Acuticoccus sp. MNP-M23]